MSDSLLQGVRASADSGEPKLLYSYSGNITVNFAGEFVLYQSISSSDCVYFRIGMFGENVTGCIVPVGDGNKSNTISFSDGSKFTVMHTTSYSSYGLNGIRVEPDRNNRGREFDIFILVYNAPLTNGPPFV